MTSNPDKKSLREYLFDFFIVYCTNGLVWAVLAIVAFTTFFWKTSLATTSADNTYLNLLAGPVIFFLFVSVLKYLKIITTRTKLGLIFWALVYGVLDLIYSAILRTFDPNLFQGKDFLAEILFGGCFAIIFFLSDRFLKPIVAKSKWYKKIEAKNFYEDELSSFLKKYLTIFYATLFVSFASLLALDLGTKLLGQPGIEWRTVLAGTEIGAATIGPIMAILLYWFAKENQILIEKKKPLVWGTIIAYGAFSILLLPVLVLYKNASHIYRIYWGLPLYFVLPLLSFSWGIGMYLAMISSSGEKGSSLDSVRKLFSNSWRSYQERFKVFLQILIAPILMGEGGRVAIALGYPFAGFVVQSLNVIGFLVLMLGNIALMVSMIRKTGFKESYVRAFKLFFPFLWIFILFYLVVLGSFIMLIVPGLIMIVWFQFYNFALVSEEKRGLNALTRSYEYVQGYWWPLFWRTLLVLAVVFVPLLMALWALTSILGSLGLTIVSMGVQITYAFILAYAFNLYENMKKLKSDVVEKSSNANRKFFAVSAAIGLIALIAIVSLIVKAANSGGFRLNFGTGGNSVQTLNGQWQEYDSDQGSFKVLFPIFPTFYAQDGNIPGITKPVHQELYSAQTSDGTGYYVIFTTFPWSVDLSDERGVLDFMTNLFASNVGGTITTSNFTTDQSSTAIDYTVKQNNGTYARGRAILNGQNLYQLFVNGAPQNYNESDYEKFINSFQLVPTRNIPVASTSANQVSSSVIQNLFFMNQGPQDYATSSQSGETGQST